MFRKHVLPFLAFLFYSTLKWTWRIRIVESASLKAALQNKTPVVYAHFHGHELGILFLLKPYRVAAMISTSKDGELMDKLVRYLGARTSRGSSTRGGTTALRGIIRLARDNWNPSVAVDGPKGPIYKVKPGVFEISKIINGPIFPLAVAADRAFTFERSWNKTFLPLPFARVTVVFGDAIGPISRDDDGRDANLALSLETALTNAGQQARNLIAAP